MKELLKIDIDTSTIFGDIPAVRVNAVKVSLTHKEFKKLDKKLRKVIEILICGLRRNTESELEKNK